MIPPVRLIQAILDRDEVHCNLQATFGFLWVLVSIQLHKEQIDGHGDYNVLAWQLIEEWNCCRNSQIFWKELTASQPVSSLKKDD